MNRSLIFGTTCISKRFIKKMDKLLKQHEIEYISQRGGRSICSRYTIMVQKSGDVVRAVTNFFHPQHQPEEYLYKPYSYSTEESNTLTVSWHVWKDDAPT